MINSSKKYNTRLKRLKTALNKNNVFFIFSFLLYALFSSCATVQQPTGGPKDENPPEILEISPKNLTPNFTEKEIRITFDEFVKLQNEFTEISISPDMEEEPMYKINRRSLVVTLPDSLDENTTYAINFGNAIVDVNEGNQLKNFSYVFSTGPEIDSLSISGTVTNALTLENEIDVSILLIPIAQDSIFGNKKANIFTKTDSSGNFSLKYLHENTYRIYALKEKNNDRIYNSPDEEIGFLKDSIVLTKDTSGIKLTVFKEIPKVFRVLNRSLDSKGKISLFFNKPLENYSLNLLNQPELDSQKISEIVPTKDSIYLWLPDYTFDSLQIEIKEKNEVLDTVLLKRNKKDVYDTQLALTDNLNNSKVDKINHIFIKTSAPLKEFVKGKIKLLEDSIPRENFQIQLDTNSQRQAQLKYNWKPKKNYSIEYEEGAFIGFFGEQSIDAQRSFTYDDTEDYGDIILTVEIKDSSQYYIIELLTEKDDVLKRIPLNENRKIDFRNIKGGKYRVRVVYDDNKNGKWDTGDVENLIQPEKIWYWDKIIAIRPNWEQEEKISIPLKKNAITIKPEKKEELNDDEPIILEEEENTEENQP